MSARAAYTLQELVEVGLTSRSIRDAVASGIPATEILREFVAQLEEGYDDDDYTDFAIVRQLLRVGARADANIMHAAVDRSRDDLLALLIEEGGGDVDARNAAGETLLMRAAWMQATLLTRILLAHGVDVNMTDSKGQTALHYAAQASIDDFFALLEEPTVDINVKTNEGITPLMEAAREGIHKEAIWLLLLNPSLDLDAVDNEGNSTLDYIDEEAWRLGKELVEYAHKMAGERRRWDSKGAWITGIMNAAQERPY
jgi:ankyrin repeat protein